MFNKRGITPLVATILLVAFSVGLGALVMSWGEDYIEAKAEFVQGTAEVKSGCDAAALSIIQIAGQAQACYTPGTISLWIDNGPDVDLYNIQARIAGKEGVSTVQEILKEPLLKANAVKSSFSYDTSVGPVLQVKLTPKIWTGQDIAICAQSSLNVEYIPPCQ